MRVAVKDVTMFACICCAGAVLWIGCLIVHAQAPAPPGTPIVSTGSPGIMVGGQPIAAEPFINFQSANGIIETAVDNPAMSRVDVTPGFNTALISTHDTVHSNENFCDSVNGTQGYTCRLSYKALAGGYVRGMTFLLGVDTTCQGVCSVNIDNKGLITLYQSDGVT